MRRLYVWCTVKVATRLPKATGILKTQSPANTATRIPPTCHDPRHQNWYLSEHGIGGRNVAVDSLAAADPPAHAADGCARRGGSHANAVRAARRALLPASLAGIPATHTMPRLGNSARTLSLSQERRGKREEVERILMLSVVVVSLVYC